MTDTIRENRLKRRREHYKKNREKILEYMKEYNKNNFEKISSRRKKKYYSTPDECREKSKIRARQTRLKKVYKITQDDWDNMFLKQGNACAICKTTEPIGKRPWNTDHCHSSGKVRGILCRQCNHLLGNAKDKIETLESAIRYLKENES